jgi:ABC transporter, phosphonate, periplasmic substrate-binding protein
VAVPVWNGKPLYQSYLIVRSDAQAETLADLAGTVHAFSDPDSNSGYLVTRAALAEMGTSPTKFFRQFFYTYGHRNVIRLHLSGLRVDKTRTTTYFLTSLFDGKRRSVWNCVVHAVPAVRVTVRLRLGAPPRRQVNHILVPLDLRARQHAVLTVFRE